MALTGIRVPAGFLRLSKLNWRVISVMSSFAESEPHVTLESTDRTSMQSYSTKLYLTLKLWADENGQDLIEYALMAGFVAVAAGALMPGVSQSISVILSKVGITLSKSSTQGS